MASNLDRPVIIGTAGHIDHGKTSLVHALTGIDPDRLPEEKARGMTIDLGFAHLTLGGRRVTVLGHPGFVGCAAGFVPGLDVAMAMTTNRLVTDGAPVPTELLWREVLEAANEVLS